MAQHLARDEEEGTGRSPSGPRCAEVGLTQSPAGVVPGNAAGVALVREPCLLIGGREGVDPTTAIGRRCSALFGQVEVWANNTMHVLVDVTGCRRVDRTPR